MTVLKIGFDQVWEAWKDNLCYGSIEHTQVHQINLATRPRVAKKEKIINQKFSKINKDG